MKTGIGKGSHAPENRKNGDEQKRKGSCTEKDPFLFSAFHPKIC